MQPNPNATFIEDCLQSCANWGLIPTEFRQCMTWEEQVLWLTKFVKETLLPAVNENTEAFNTLKDFVEHYFDNLDVQEEINNKLNQMAADGYFDTLMQQIVTPMMNEFRSETNQTIATFENTVNTTVAQQDARIQEVANLTNQALNTTPIAVASTSDMTDHTKIYVNTTDGDWYYWNGSAWTSGGTYQATGIDDNSVHLNALTALAKNDGYTIVHAEDLIWRNYYRWTNGDMASSSDGGIVSQPFLATKGSTVTVDSDYTGRLTFWSLDGTYIGDTGSLKTLSAEPIPYDCYCGVSIKASEGIVEVADINNTDMVLTGYVSNNDRFIRNALEFTRSTASQVKSNKIFMGKGSVIQAPAYGLKKNNGNYTETVVYVKVVTYKKDGLTTLATYDYTVNNRITLTEDCYVEIYCRKRGNQAIEDSEVPKFKNSPTVFYAEPTTLPASSELALNLYVGASDKIEIINSPSSNGHVYVTWGSDLIMNGGGATVFSYTISEFISNCSGATSASYAGKTWLDLANAGMVYYDRLTSSLKVGGAINSRKDELTVPLLKNSYNNPYAGLLLELKNRDVGDANKIYNSILWNESIDWKTFADKFNTLMNTTNKLSTYCFFTDPHYFGNAGAWWDDFKHKNIGLVQKVYNSTSCDFIVDGGDWLNNSDTPEQASDKIAFKNSSLASIFKNFYPLVGNHDVNEQGTEELSNGAMLNIGYRKFGKTYYSFESPNAVNYAFDTGKGQVYTMDSYKWEQVAWFGQKLVEDDPEHSTVFMHIVFDGSNHDQINGLADNVTKMIAAFNAHTTITLNSITYDFTGCTGHVDYVMSGHTHVDVNDTVNGVLCIAVKNVGASTHDFFLVMNDYTAGKVKLIRVATSGDDLEFSI